MDATGIMHIYRRDLAAGTPGATAAIAAARLAMQNLEPRLAVDLATLAIAETLVRGTVAIEVRGRSG